MLLHKNYNIDEIEKSDIHSIFIGKKEFKLMQKISAEYLQKVQGQYVLYIKIDRQKTESNIYGETKHKIIEGNPIKLPATVAEIAKMVNDDFGIRFDKDLRVSFLNVLNEQYGVTDVRMGDFVEWQQKKYEIVAIDRTRKFFGLEEFCFEINCTCKARE